MQPMETCKGHNQVTKITNEIGKSNYLTYSKKWEMIFNGFKNKMNMQNDMVIYCFEIYVY